MTLLLTGCAPRGPRNEQPVGSVPATSPVATAASDTGATVDSLPPVVIESPHSNARVVGPFEAAGTANVFEAVVGLRVRDARGAVVVDTTALASCGTGCRGTWRVAISLPDSLRGRLTLEAFAPSARDGAPLHLVHVRVVRE